MTRSAVGTRRGFTLAELAVAITLMGIVMGLVFPFFKMQSSAIRRQAGRFDAQQSAAFAINALDQDIRGAGADLAPTQRLAVHIGPTAITFNANLVTRDSGDVRAMSWDPDADLAATSVLTGVITLPNTPGWTYTGAGTGFAETVSYWTENDTTGVTGDLRLMKRINARPPEIVARGLRANPGNQAMFQYIYRRPDGTLDSIPNSALPLRSGDARVDSLRLVRVQLTARFRDRGGQIVDRTLRRTLRIMNAGARNVATCGGAPVFTSQVIADDTLVQGSPAVTVNWLPADDETSGERDVERYAIFRRLPAAGSFAGLEPLISVPAGLASYSYLDTSVESGQEWIYGIAAQDCGLLLSPVVAQTLPTASVIVP